MMITEPVRPLSGRAVHNPRPLVEWCARLDVTKLRPQGVFAGPSNTEWILTWNAPLRTSSHHLPRRLARSRSPGSRGRHSGAQRDKDHSLGRFNVRQADLNRPLPRRPSVVSVDRGQIRVGAPIASDATAPGRARRAISLPCPRASSTQTTSAATSGPSPKAPKVMPLSIRLAQPVTGSDPTARDAGCRRRETAHG